MIRRRTRAQIVKLQLKQGKKPTLEDAEDFADLSILQQDQLMSKPLPVVLKIPSMGKPDLFSQQCSGSASHL